MSGSVVVTSSVVIDSASIPAFARALADNTALPLSRYQSTLLLKDSIVNYLQDIAATVAAIAGMHCSHIPYKLT